MELNGLNGALFCSCVSWLQLVLCVVCFEFSWLHFGLLTNSCTIQTFDLESESNDLIGAESLFVV